MRKYWVGGLLALLSLTLALWAGFGSSAKAAPAKQKLTKVTLQLKWVTQSQFAGYYAAKAKGYYKAMGLDVNIKVGGPDITPEQVVASGQADFGLDWLPSLLATRDTGTDIVNIAQVFTRSGMTEVSFKDSGIDSIAKMKGKTVGVWCCGNQFELFVSGLNHAFVIGAKAMIGTAFAAMAYGISALPSGRHRATTIARRTAAPQPIAKPPSASWNVNQPACQSSRSCQKACAIAVGFGSRKRLMCRKRIASCQPTSTRASTTAAGPHSLRRCRTALMPVPGRSRGGAPRAPG